MCSSTHGWLLMRHLSLSARSGSLSLYLFLYPTCTFIGVPHKYTNRIVFLMRGGCMFVDKLRNAQQAGALAAIVMGKEERG